MLIYCSLLAKQCIIIVVPFLYKLCSLILLIASFKNFFFSFFFQMPLLFVTWICILFKNSQTVPPLHAHLPVFPSHSSFYLTLGCLLSMFGMHQSSADFSYFTSSFLLVSLITLLILHVCLYYYYYHYCYRCHHYFHLLF